MRCHRGLITVCVLMVGSATAENLTQANVEKAQEIIQSAVQAYGGTDRLADLKTIVIKHKTKGTAVGQSYKAEPPWDRNDSSGMSAVDLQKEIFVTANTGAGGGFEFDNGSIINGDKSYQVDHRAGTATHVAEPDYAGTAGPFMRVTPALLVHQLQERAYTAHYLGETIHNGSKHDVVGFTMEVGPSISLYFDKKTNLLTHSERMLPNFGLVEYSFKDYENVDGIPFNKKFELHLNGDLNMERQNLKTAINTPVEKHAVVNSKLTQVASAEPDELSRQEISQGVYLIGENGTYSMFVEMEDFVIAVGGTAGIEARITELRKVIPKKPISYGVMTHHHSDHVLATPTYAEQGATVIAATAHAAVVKEAAGEGVELTLETVDKRKVLSDGRRRVEIIDIGPTAHTEHLLVTWLPKEKILFEADHFAMPRSGPVPPAVSSTRTFAKALRRHEIEPAILVSAHRAQTGTMKDLKTALDKKASNKQAIAAAAK